MICRTILWSHHAKTGKNTEINKQSHVNFWLKERMELSHIHLALIRGMLQMFKKPQVISNENERKFPRPIQAEWKRFWAWKISGHSVIFEGFLSEFWRTKPTNSTLLNVSASFDSLGAPGGIQVVEWYVIYMLNLGQYVAVLSRYLSALGFWNIEFEKSSLMI